MALSQLDFHDDSDPALIERTRAGDTAAYAQLHARHASAARALAWRVSRSPSDADDLVSEGFARVLAVLRRGRGPDAAFRPYLLSVIRRLAYDRTDRERRESPSSLEIEPAAAPEVDPVIAGFESELAAAALATLPERWRAVLWHTEVEGERPAQVAERLGLSPNAVAALAYRAREGLRQAYLGLHASSTAEAGSACAFVSGRLAAYIRGNSSDAVTDRIAEHLDECDRCRAAWVAMLEESTSLRAIVALAVLGPLAGGYLRAVDAGAAAASARPRRFRRLHRGHAASTGSAPIGVTVAAGVSALVLGAGLVAWNAGRHQPTVRTGQSTAMVLDLHQDAPRRPDPPSSTTPGTEPSAPTDPVQPPSPPDRSGGGEGTTSEPPGPEVPGALPPVPRRPPILLPPPPGSTTTPPTTTVPPTTSSSTSSSTTSSTTSTSTSTSTTSTTTPTTTSTSIPVAPGRVLEQRLETDPSWNNGHGQLRLTLTNAGAAPLTGVEAQVSFSSPSTVFEIEVGGPCATEGQGVVRCRFGALAAGETRTVVMSIHLPAGTGELFVESGGSGTQADGSLMTEEPSRWRVVVYRA